MNGNKPAAKSTAVATRDDIPANASGWHLEGMTEEQRAEATTIESRVNSRPLRPRIELEGTAPDRAVIVGSGSQASKTLHSMRLFDVLGTRSTSYVEDYLRRLTEAVRLSGSNEDDSNAISAAIGLVAAIAPRSELEATMALQMVAANEAALSCFTRSRRAEYLEQATAYSNMANKAMRSFGLQAEAIAKIRRGGEQVVRHVHVNEGGQAVIAGTVNTGGGANG